MTSTASCWCRSQSRMLEETAGRERIYTVQISCMNEE